MKECGSWPNLFAATQAVRTLRFWNFSGIRVQTSVATSAGGGYRLMAKRSSKQMIGFERKLSGFPYSTRKALSGLLRIGTSIFGPERR